MLFSKTIFAAAAALVTAVTAQNAFTLPAIGSITAGQSFTITWTPTTGATDTVTLLLVQDQGNSAALVTVATITSTAPNSGTFVWNVPTSITKGSQYAFEIISNTNKNLSNFSDRFAIDSTNTITSRASTSGSSTGTSSSSASTSSSSSTSASTTSTTSGSITTSKSATDSSKTSSSATTTSGNSTSGSSASVGSATTSPTSKSSTAAGATGVKVGSGLVGAVLGGLAMVL